MVETTFSFITQLRQFVRGYYEEYRYPHNSDETPDKTELTEFLKKTASFYGAVLSGVTETDEECVYETRGRGVRYGLPVDDYLPRTLIFAFEMSVEEMRHAPGIREAAEVAGTYLKIAVPALVIASYLRGLGYSAVAHIDGESELVLPPLAERAGLGQIGRHGLLVNKKYGSRIRLAAVTTDAELEIDEPVDFNMPKICEACRKCSDLCPVEAIPKGSILENYAAEVRSIDHEACFSAWRKFGTDCGVCVAVCPYSKVGHGGNGRAAKPGEENFLKSVLFGS